MSITLDQIREALPDARERGGHFIGRCPVCNGKDKLEFKPGDKTPVVIHCHKCNAPFTEILEKLGLNGSVDNGSSPRTIERAPAWAGSARPTVTENGDETHEKPPKDLGASWLWKTEADARAAYEALPAVRHDAAARRFFEASYGLSGDDLPDDWRLFEYPGCGAGAVYLGHAPDGSPAYKFKGFGRDAKGKRKTIRFLHGSGDSAIWINGAPDLPTVIVSGEEKGIPPNLAGFSVLCPLAGEKQLSSAWIQKVIDHNPERVILANDADAAGAKANTETAKALELAGFPADRIALVQWPAGAADGYDLNDVMKSGGAEAVRELVQNAKPWPATLPRVMNALDFIAAKRQPLAWHIEDLLPVGGKLTLSATSKFGKSLLATQAGLALASGDCDWLGWRFGLPARVLYLQAEIMDALVEGRLRKLLDTMPSEINFQRARQNFFIQEIAKGRPNFATPEGCARAEAVIRAHKPDVIILDPLAALWPGLEENSAEAMGAALGYLQDLGLKHHCAVILVHHHGKGGTARGSSVFEAWPESDLQCSFLSEDDPSIAKVTMRLRCAFNSGPIYLKRPTPENLWFERMPDGWTPEKPGGRPRAANPQAVVMTLQAKGELRHGELVQVLMGTLSVSESTAKRVIDKARADELIECPHGIYRVAKKSPK